MPLGSLPGATSRAPKGVRGPRLGSAQHDAKVEEYQWTAHTRQMDQVQEGLPYIEGYT